MRLLWEAMFSENCFRVATFGESHGAAIGCVVDGCPPRIALSPSDVQTQLDRRRPGSSRHVSQRREPDAAEILSGVFEGQTTGAPIAMLIRNTDAKSGDYDNLRDTFRPGHADTPITKNTAFATIAAAAAPPRAKPPQESPPPPWREKFCKLWAVWKFADGWRKWAG